MDHTTVTENEPRTRELMNLVEVLPQFGVKPGFIEQLKLLHEQTKAAQVDDMLEILRATAKQNRAVASIYGYSQLEHIARDIETRVDYLLSMTNLTA